MIEYTHSIQHSDMNTVQTYEDSSGNEHIIVPVGQGSAYAVQPEYIDYQDRRYTDPNLYREVTPLDERVIVPGEVDKREYQMNVMGTQSVRTTTVTLHDENSTTVEIP